MTETMKVAAMTKTMAVTSAMSALCAITLLAGGARAQDPEVKGFNFGAKPSVPQLRAPQPAEKSVPKIQERAGAGPTTTVAAGPTTNGPLSLTPSAPPAAPQGAPQAAPAAPANETQNFQGWTVTCLPPPADNSGRTCIAKMGVIKSNEDRRPILFVSVVKTGNTATFVVQTPTGIDLKSGATVQIGKAAPRHLTYESCEPALCTATVQLDDALLQELASAPSATASWVGLGVGEVKVEYALQEARNTLAYLGSK
jgi:invasion protein IalB